MGSNLTIRLLGKCILTAAALVLAGCETPPSNVEANFGSSVRNTIVLQTADPGQGAFGLDGTKAEAVLRAYQSDVAKPEKVEREMIQINLGK